MRGKYIFIVAGLVFIFIALGFAGWWIRGYMSLSAMLVSTIFNEPFPRWAFDNQDSLQYAIRWGLLAIPLGIIGCILLVAGFMSPSKNHQNQ